MQTVVNQTHSPLKQNIVRVIDTVLIPSIQIITYDLPFTFKCLQFPLKVDFSMIIKRAQGQTFSSGPAYQRRNVYVKLHPALPWVIVITIQYHLISTIFPTKNPRPVNGYLSQFKIKLATCGNRLGLPLSLHWPRSPILCH